MSIKMLLVCPDISIRIKKENKLLKEETTVFLTKDIAVPTWMLYLMLLDIWSC